MQSLPLTYQLFLHLAVEGDSGSWVFSLDGQSVYGMVVAAVLELGIAYFIRAEDFLTRFALAWGHHNDLDKLLPTNTLRELQLEQDEPRTIDERTGVEMIPSRNLSYYASNPRYLADWSPSLSSAHPERSRNFYREQSRMQDPFYFLNAPGNSDYVRESSLLSDRLNQRPAEDSDFVRIKKEIRDLKRRIPALQIQDLEDRESARSDSRDQDSTYGSEYTNSSTNSVNPPLRSKSYLGSIRDGDSTYGSEYTNSRMNSVNPTSRFKSYLGSIRDGVSSYGSVSGEQRSVAAQDQTAATRNPRDRRMVFPPLPSAPSPPPPFERQHPAPEQ